jgi:D-amino-acid dehydrogenase
MKVIVLGAGITGVLAAYFLASRGHEVEVIERQQDSGLETTYANGGQLSYSHAEPWANPGVLPKVVKWMFRDDAPLVLRFQPDMRMIKWGLRFLANCTHKKAHESTINVLRFSLYSKKVLHEILADVPLDFKHSKAGILHLFSNNKDLDAAIKHAEFQKQYGCEETFMDWEACKKLEPALEHAGRPVVGGIFAGMDESGDALAFTQQLARYCTEKFGTRFHYGTNITTLQGDGEIITQVNTDKGVFKGDAYVMAMGSYSSVFLRQVGIDIPIYPMKGYSISFKANEYCPHVSLTDTDHKIVYSRLGDRLRIAGTAEFAGYNHAITEKRITPIVNAVKRLFPKASVDDDMVKWACLRPQTPDGPPTLGRTSLRNLYLNTGHGTLGWTLGPGSGKLVADIIENKTPEIELAGLTVTKYLRG